jgi:RHS repeat-associated protein
VVTDGSGTVVQVLDYYPYGDERIDSSTGGFDSKRKYIGIERDDETGLDYALNRYYANERGQFISQDPTFLAIGNPAGLQNLTGLTQDAILADPQQLNSYAYGRNNPIRFKDPKGLYIESGFDVAMLGLSLYTFSQDPSWTNAGGVLLDAGSLALPGIPAVGGMALRAGKAADATYSVYQGFDAAGNVRYVGITGREVAERAAEHAQDIGSGREALQYRAIPGTGNLTKQQARLSEQSLINQYGLQKNGGALLNKINSISPSSQLYKSVPNVSTGGSGGGSLGGVLNSLSSALKQLSNALSKLKK